MDASCRRIETRWDHQPAPPAAPRVDFVPATTASIKDNFFEYLDAAPQVVPPTAENKDMRATRASIGRQT